MARLMQGPKDPLSLQQKAGKNMSQPHPGTCAFYYTQLLQQLHSVQLSVSEPRHLPILQGISDITSGRLPSERNTPDGSKTADVRETMDVMKQRYWQIRLEENTSTPLTNILRILKREPLKI
ncbi:hypothetical protein evm_009551 [Chilo suppressalis]|nr:hypothetical protein evm_009551 [Chilo suppressalis]